MKKNYKFGSVIRMRATARTGFYDIEDIGEAGWTNNYEDKI